jgi:hypothetical protein
MALGTRLPEMDRTRLRHPVRGVLASPEAEVEFWQWERPAGWSEGAATAGVARLSGRAATAAGPRPWSLVLKILRPPGGLAAENAPDSAEWRREVWAYQSGLVRGLGPGLRAPRCLAVDFPREDEAWVWLEDVADALPGPWPLSRYGTVARALGRFNAACPEARARAYGESWLGRGWLSAWVERRAPHVALIAAPEAWAAREIRAWFPPSTRGRLLALWERRGAWLRRLEGLPQCLAHRDAHPANLLTPFPDAEEGVLLDWSSAGLAPWGVEGQAMAGGALATLRADAAEAEGLGEAVFAGYAAGVADGGGPADPAALRFAFAAGASLQWTFGTMGLLLRAGLDEDHRKALEALHGRTFEALARHRAGMLDWLLGLGDEAADLERFLLAP